MGNKHAQSINHTPHGKSKARTSQCLSVVCLNPNCAKLSLPGKSKNCMGLCFGELTTVDKKGPLTLLCKWCGCTLGGSVLIQWCNVRRLIDDHTAGLNPCPNRCVDVYFVGSHLPSCKPKAQSIDVISPTSFMQVSPSRVVWLWCGRANLTLGQVCSPGAVSVVRASMAGHLANSLVSGAVQLNTPAGDQILDQLSDGRKIGKLMRMVMCPFHDVIARVVDGDDDADERTHRHQQLCGDSTTGG
jgi:hypothetical protein